MTADFCAVFYAIPKNEDGFALQLSHRMTRNVIWNIPDQVALRDKHHNKIDGSMAEMGQTRSTWATLKGLSGASAYPSPTDTVPATVGTAALWQFQTHAAHQKTNQDKATRHRMPHSPKKPETSVQATSVQAY
jgi:hypothetical protein